MRCLNALVFAGLILCGLVLLVGFILDNGSLKGLAAYLGWFLCAYSGVAYLITSTLFLAKGGGTFWKTFYPINFGLTLLAIAMFGVHDQRTVIIMGVTAIVAAGLSVVLARSHVLDGRLAPIALTLVLGIVFVEPLFSVWKYLAVFVGMLLLVNASIALRVKANQH